jgi:Nitrate reductase gamma subunit
MFLFALWPFTRLVHVFSAPLGYVTRPYIVSCSRDDKATVSQPPPAPRLGHGQPRARSAPSFLRDAASAPADSSTSWTSAGRPGVKAEALTVGEGL